MDKKAVTDILKSEGLDVAEELAVTSVRAAIIWHGFRALHESL